MHSDFNFKRSIRWLMLSLALLAGISPSALAELDHDHFGNEPDSSSFHAQQVDASHDHGDGQNTPAADHHDAYCADHCCSDSCAAGLYPDPMAMAALKSPPVQPLLTLDATTPVEERVIPPNRLR